MRILLLATLLLSLGCVQQAKPQDVESMSIPLEIAGLAPQGVPISNTSTVSPVEIGMEGQIKANLGQMRAFSITYESTEDYESLISKYKEERPRSWVLKSIKVGKGDASPLEVALTLGLASLRNYDAVTFIYGKEGCENTFCPLLGVTVISGNPARVSIDCTAYQLNPEEFAKYIAEENAAKEEARALGNEDVPPPTDAQEVINANEGACSLE